MTKNDRCPDVNRGKISLIILKPEKPAITNIADIFRLVNTDILIYKTNQKSGSAGEVNTYNLVYEDK